MSKKLIFNLAITGFALSLLVNISTIVGLNIIDNFPYVWGLHVYIFVVFVPTIFIINKNPEIKELQKTGAKNPLKMWALIFKDTPKLVIFSFFLVFIYGFVNFILFLQISEGGGPDIINGQFVLSNRGDVIKEISKQEYIMFKNNQLRGFSGIWMTFLGLPASVFWPKAKQI